MREIDGAAGRSISHFVSMSLLYKMSWLVGVIMLGAVAANGNPTYIAGSIAVIALAFLFRNPQISVPILIILSLPTGALISMIGAPAAKLPWLVSALSFSLWPVAFLSVKRCKKIPGFIQLSIIFVVYSLVLSFSQRNSLTEITAGFKRYFQGYGIMFALGFFAICAKEIRIIYKLIIFVAMLQLPFAIYELLVLVPLRGGLEAGGEATDVVAGTFGANLFGGSANAEMAAFVLIVFCFLMARWRGHLLATRTFLILASLCLAPLTLGETKIVVFIFPMILAILLRKEFIRDPVKHIPVIIVGGLLSLLFGYIYISVMDSSMVGDSLTSTIQYNVGANGYGNNILNRTTVLSFWLEKHSIESPGYLFFGHGIGSAYLGMNNPVPGHIALQYPRYGIDLTTASTLLWDTGLVGLILHISIYLCAWGRAARLWTSVRNASVRADLLGIQAALGIFIVFTVYRDSSVNLIAFEMVIALVLGYLAWLIHSHEDLSTVKYGKLA